MTALTIRSKIVREGGTKITLDQTEYHFRPKSDEPGAPHIADVENRTHIARLLAIAEGYEVHLPPNDADERADPDKVDEGDGDTNADPQPGYDDLQKVLAAGDGEISGLSDETINAAFVYLEKRQPHPKSKRATIVAKIFEIAGERNMISTVPDDITDKPSDERAEQ